MWKLPPHETSSFEATPSKNWNSTEPSLVENLVEGSPLPRRKIGSRNEVMVSFKKIANKN